MTAKRKTTHSHHSKPHPLSSAMAEWCLACLSFPNFSDISWKMMYPDMPEPRKGKTKS